MGGAVGGTETLFPLWLSNQYFSTPSPSPSPHPGPMVHKIARAFCSGLLQMWNHSHIYAGRPDLWSAFPWGKWNPGLGECQFFSDFSLLFIPSQKMIKGLTLSFWACCCNQLCNILTAQLSPSSAELLTAFLQLSFPVLIVSWLTLNMLLLYIIRILPLFSAEVLFYCYLIYPTQKYNFHPLPFS